MIEIGDGAEAGGGMMLIAVVGRTAIAGVEL